MALNVSERFPSAGWKQACFRSLQDDFGGFLENLSDGLVDKHGHAVSGLLDVTKGITVELCYRHCNSDSPKPGLEWPNFRIQTFLSTCTSYMLPWLALTAQLPYGTGDPLQNTMSFCMAVGSPAMATYSLTVTILNRRWIRRQCASIIKSMRDNASRNSPPEQNLALVRIRAVGYLLAESQEEPLHLLIDDLGQLRDAIFDQGERWLLEAKAQLESTRRGVTPSLVAQVISAAIAYIFTIILTFSLAEVREVTFALQAAAGTLWLWLIPVICGWIFAGTQYKDSAIQDALGNTAGGGILGVTAPEADVFRVFSLAEDELQRGPVFNYARLFTWSHNASRLLRAMRLFADQATTSPAEKPRGNLSRSPDPDEMALPPNSGGQQGQDEITSVPSRPYEITLALPSPLDKETAATSSINGSAVDPSGASTKHPKVGVSQCGLTDDGRSTGDAEAQLGQQDAKALYDDFGKLPQTVSLRMFVGSATALFVQWGTTGSSILMAIRTPTTGLGCRSGSYLVYGVMATLAWACLLVSMILSHAAMVRERKVIATLNTGWVIATTLFEYIGGFNNCWCHGVQLSRGWNGYVTLFGTSEELRAEAQEEWAGGITAAILVCTLTIGGLVLGSRSNRDND